jgi:uncharacterized membrane protein
VESLLHFAAHYVSLSIESIAIVVIAVGAIEAVCGAVRLWIRRDVKGVDQRVVWMKFARALVAGLTFQLAADVVGTSYAPSWDELGRLGAIAVIRTFLSYFLDQEVTERRAMQKEALEREAASNSNSLPPPG